MKRPYNLYWNFIVGASFGFEFFRDDEDDTAYALSLGIVRFLLTRDRLHE
jgi:hypothetical protein